MAGGDIAIGAGKGAATGAIAGAYLGSVFPGIGNIVGAVVGGIIGAIAGGVEGKMEGDEKDEMVANQQEAATAQDLASQSAARRSAAAMHEQAAADPRGTSSTILRKTQLQREANTNYADIRDTGNPFRSVDDKATKLSQNYGKPAVTTKVAA